jgi:N-acetylglucosaminyldiphosphoundecaprenol N-acetyl-beta-D-mannosaminyltransferase
MLKTEIGPVYPPAMQMGGSLDLMGIPVHKVGASDILNFMATVIETGKQAIVLNVNVYIANTAFRNPWMKALFNESQLVFCDGDGIRWGLRILGHIPPPKVTYNIWLWLLADWCQDRDFSIYLLGAQPGVAEQAAIKLKNRYPGLRILGTHQGFFEKQGPENDAVVDQINRLCPDILLVCFGTGYQEQWVADNASRLSVHVLLTGGAALKYAAGVIDITPQWIARLQMEWFYRFLQEPGRLFVRYIIGNPLFIIRIILERLRRQWKKRSIMTKLSDFYKNRPVLVVGADGFLGSNCTLALHKLGARVTAMTRRAKAQVVGFTGNIVRGDLKDPNTAAQVVAGQHIVFDFVGTFRPVYSNVLDAEELSAHYRPHVNLYIACSQCNPPPLVIFCSSRLVYGKPQYLPVDEKHPLQPGCFYAAHKLLLERYLHVLSNIAGLRYVVVRLSNPYGPCASRASKNHTIINRFIQQAREGKTLTIYGDGKQLRDYIYVDDAIDTFLKCAATPECRDNTFNFGGIKSISLRKAVELIVHRFGGCIQTVPWSSDYKLIETGDYHTDLTKLSSFIDLQLPRSFEEGLTQMSRLFEEGLTQMSRLFEEGLTQMSTK